MFRRRNRSRERLDQEVPLASKKKGKSEGRKKRSKESPSSFANFRTLFRLTSNPNGNSRRKDKKARLQMAALEMGMRRSTSTHFTRSTTTRSSAFFFEPVTMSGFLLAEEMAAIEQGKQDIRDIDIGEHDEIDATSKTQLGCTWKALDEQLQEEEEEQPLHRLPPPESYFELTRNENDELGCIAFEFDSMEDARKEATRRHTPILCIEAEIPGDVTAGETIFSHPLIVEAAESLFVTVQPRQLQPQDDEDNNDQNRRFFCNSSCRTRVRILDDKGMDVLAPVEHMSIAEVVSALVRGLESYRTHIPQYLKLLLEQEAGKVQVLSKTRFRETQGEVVFGMFDPVAAEVEFAGLEGILSTRCGALVRQPVVRVTYDTRRLTYCELVRHALRRTGATAIYYNTNDERIAAQLEVQHFHDYRKVQQRYADGVVENSTPDIKVTVCFGNVRADRCPKPALKSSILRFVPLTSLQATRANRLIHYQKFDEAMHLLSPRQGLIAMQALRAHHSKDFQDVVDVPICNAWKELCFAVDDMSPLIEKLHYVMDDDETESLTDDEDPLQ